MEKDLRLKFVEISQLKKDLEPSSDSFGSFNNQRLDLQPPLNYSSPIGNMEKSAIANSTDITKAKGALSSFNFGSSLIEIAALTSLIGSTAAESLALGDKGPAGLVWAMMTVFGAIPVVRLFIATSVPGWLRESMGVSNTKSDAVVGLFQDADTAFRFQDRKEPAIAVESEIKVGKIMFTKFNMHALILSRMLDRRT